MRARRPILSALLLMGLAACSDCNMLSSPMPTHCEVGLGAAAIVAAPILVPYVLLEQALE